MLRRNQNSSIISLLKWVFVKELGYIHLLYVREASEVDWLSDDLRMDFTDIVFCWSLEDIFNEDLYKDNIFTSNCY